jgi:hypothetical protein
MAGIQTLVPVWRLHEEYIQLYQQHRHQHHINNKHEHLKQPHNHSRTGGDSNAGMMKGYATLLHPTTPVAGSRDEAVSFRSPPLHTLSIARSPSPVNRVHCSNTAQARSHAKHPRRHAMRVLAIITANSSNSDRLMLHNLARPSRSRRNSGRIPFSARFLISVHRIPHPATVACSPYYLLFYDFTAHIPTPIAPIRRKIRI